MCIFASFSFTDKAGDLAALRAFARNLSGSCVQSWTGSDPCSGPWNGIGCNTLGGVVSITLQDYTSNCWGTINFSVVLKNVTSIVIRNTYVSGSISFDGFYPLLTTVDLSRNKFNGTISTLSSLSPPMQSLDLSYNQFTGPLVLDSLPTSMKLLQLHHNRFCGSVVLDRLPMSLTSLRLEYNELTSISFGESLFALNYSLNQSIHGMRVCVNWMCFPKFDCRLLMFVGLSGCPLELQRYVHIWDSDFVFSFPSLDGLCFAEIGVNYVGNDLRSSSALSASACCEMCAQESDCKFFTYVSSTGYCWRKSSNAGRSVSSGYISGYPGKERDLEHKNPFFLLSLRLTE